MFVLDCLQVCLCAQKGTVNSQGGMLMFVDLTPQKLMKMGLRITDKQSVCMFVTQVSKLYVVFE